MFWYCRRVQALVRLADIVVVAIGQAEHVKVRTHYSSYC
jgi:5,10-methylene-tetrahydrofolate dehydrogenase/methenyl tetrahydrofolate cyclohydrolase